MVGGIWLVDKVMFSPAPPCQKVELHQDEAQDQPEAANERFLPSLKFLHSGNNCPHKACGQEAQGVAHPPSQGSQNELLCKRLLERSEISQVPGTP